MELENINPNENVVQAIDENAQETNGILVDNLEQNVRNGNVALQQLETQDMILEELRIKEKNKLILNAINSLQEPLRELLLEAKKKYEQEDYIEISDDLRKSLKGKDADETVIVEKVMAMIRQPEDGKDADKVDYELIKNFITEQVLNLSKNKNGNNEEINLDLIAAEVIKKLPKIKEAKEKKPETAQQIIQKLKKEGFSYDDLKDVPDFQKIIRLASQSSKTVSLIELDDIDYSALKKNAKGNYVLGGGTVDTVVSGTGIIVNATDAANPIVNLSAESIASLALADTAVQPAALNLKANLASPTFTGTVSGITSTMVGLGNVDNTSNATERAAIRTVSNMRVNPRTNSTSTEATLKPNLSVANVYFLNRQTGTLIIDDPIGTPVIGETLYIEVSSLSAETLTINATYIPFGVAFPATTTAGKSFLMTCTFNGTNWRTTWANEI